MAEASVPQDLSLAKFVLYHVLIFNKSCEKRGTMYLYSLQYYDFILKTLPVKWRNRICGNLNFTIFQGSMPPDPPRMPRALGARYSPPPPPNNHPGYATGQLDWIHIA